MPRAEKPHWLSLLLGRPVETPPPASVEEIPRWRSTLDFSAANVNLPQMARVHEGVMLRERKGVPLTAEIYVPKGNGPFPAFLYLHGGGWCAGSAEGTRKLAMRFAEQGYVVVNLDYGLAPEHPFPWAVEDCVYAARWAVCNAVNYDGDASHLVIGGDSAGANLAAATITVLTGSGGEVEGGDLTGVAVTFSAAVLLYGVFDFPLLFQEPGAYVGSIEVRYNLAYLGPHFLKHHRSPLVSPIYASDLAAFPPTYLSCGTEDSLLGQSLAMAKALAQAGVPTTLSGVAGADHAFAQLEGMLPAAKPEVERIFTWLKAHTLS